MLSVGGLHPYYSEATPAENALKTAKPKETTKCDEILFFPRGFRRWSVDPLDVECDSDSVRAKSLLGSHSSLLPVA